ncbi:MAG: hypothetical protein ACQKBY_09450 [Verrucomicrobiales bacterium]
MRILLSIIALAALGMGLRPSEPAPRHKPPTKLERLWDTAEINPSEVFRIDKAIALFQANRDRYEGIERMRDGGVPAPIIFTLHGRESTWSFRKHLHEGSPLTGRTRWVPKGRPKRGNPPFTFEESAEDALYLLKDLESKDWSTVESALDQIETYNGLGYRKYRPIESPYLWAGTNHYQRGKYVADGRYSSTAVDKQLGCAAILKRMEERGMHVGFR